MSAKFNVTGLAQAVSEFCRAYDLLSTEGTKAVKVMLVAEGIDCTNAGAVGKAITPHLATHYGVKLVKSERVSKFGDMTFPESAKGKTAANSRTILTNLIVGKSAAQKPAKVIKVTRAMKEAAAAFVELCGTKAAAIAALKTL